MKVKNVVGSTQGLELAKDILYEVVDLDTVLFLSGGSTPKPLYEILAKEKKLKPGAVALVDERFGEVLHENSNEKMIQETGLFSYFLSVNASYYHILKQGKKRGEVTAEYNSLVKNLFSKFPKRVAILGIGQDGHTAGIPAGIHKQSLSSINSKFKIQNLVTNSDDFPGEFRQRISLTFSALSKMDLLIVLVFGENKKDALRKMFLPGSLKDLPARFYLRPDIAKKTILITDQTL